MLINQILLQFRKNRSLDPQVYMLKILNVKTQTRSMYKKGRYLKMKSKRKELKIVMSNIERDNFLQTKLEKIHNSRIITSLYFDTEDFYLYKQSKNTDVDKFKIRFRKYSNSKTIFKEFKFNHFDSKYKEVQETEFNSLEEIKCLFYKSYKLIPSIYVSYERDYYLYKDTRITVDKNLFFKTHELRSLQTNEYSAENLNIVEYKLFNEILDIEKYIKPNTEKFSKYEYGIKKIYRI